MALRPPHGCPGRGKEGGARGMKNRFIFVLPVGCGARLSFLFREIGGAR